MEPPWSSPLRAAGRGTPLHAARSERQREGRWEKTQGVGGGMVSVSSVHRRSTCSRRSLHCSSRGPRPPPPPTPNPPTPPPVLVAFQPSTSHPPPPPRPCAPPAKERGYAEHRSRSSTLQRGPPAPTSSPRAAQRSRSGCRTTRTRTIERAWQAPSPRGEVLSAGAPRTEQRRRVTSTTAASTRESLRAQPAAPAATSYAHGPRPRRRHAGGGARNQRSAPTEAAAHPGRRRGPDPHRDRRVLGDGRAVTELGACGGAGGGGGGAVRVLPPFDERGLSAPRAAAAPRTHRWPRPRR